MAEIRIHWSVLDIQPGIAIPNHAQLIKRTARGLLMSDSVGWAWNVPMQRTQREIDESIAYTDVRIHYPDQNNNEIVPETYRTIILNDELSDSDNSKTIAESLGLDGDLAYTRNFNIVAENGYRHAVDVLPENNLISFSIYCEIHNKLKIVANQIFPIRLYTFNTNDPETYRELRGYGRNSNMIWPNDVANTWQKQWCAIVSRIQPDGNSRIEIIQSFNKFSSAIKATHKYIKKITNNNRLRDFPDFRKESFVYNDLSISLHKEKDL